MANIYLFTYYYYIPKKLFVEFALVFLFVATLPEFAKIRKPGPSSGDASERFPSGRSSRTRAKEGAQERERERR
jgi:hypothetical protein